MERICVFLSSKANLPENYVQAAIDVATWIGKSGRTLVYGGSRAGLMETLATTVRENGGRVIGVVPQTVVNRDLVSDASTTVFYTADLQDRKSTFMRESEAFVALPGGIGTLDEVFTVLAAKTLEKYKRRVVLYNAGGCWDELIKMIDTLSANGLITEHREDLLNVANNIEELERLLSE